MGSLAPSPSSPLPEHFANSYRIYLSFCPKDPSQIRNAIECYDATTNSFHKVTMVPGLPRNCAIKDFAMIALGDSIYVIGGRLCDKKSGTPEVVYRDVLSNVLRYNVGTGTWTKCADMITPRFNFACTVHENKIYIAGGQTSLESVKGTSLAEFYDPALNECKSLPNMSTLRYKCVAVSWKGKVHVVGGFAEKENTSNHPQQGQIYAMERCSAEVFNTESEKWEVETRMWELDVPPNQIVPIGDKLYSSGDCFIHHYQATHSRALQMIMTRTMRGYNMKGVASGMRSEVHLFDTSENGDMWRSLEAIYDEGGEKFLCCHCCVLKQFS